MERKSEIVEGLEALREAMLGYDAAADPKGAAWDELRVEFDRSVLALIVKAERMVMGEMVPVREQVIAGVDLALKGGDSTCVQVMRVELERRPHGPSYAVKLEQLNEFRRGCPATFMIIQASTAFELDADLVFIADGATGVHTFWGESARGRDFIAAKLKVRARIGKHYRVGRPLDVVMKSHPTRIDLDVYPTPYLAGEGPFEVDPRACLVMPLTEVGSIWLQNQAADGVPVLWNGVRLADSEASPSRQKAEARIALSSRERHEGNTGHIDDEPTR